MRFIHIGVGGFGTLWVKVLKANRNVEVVALVDVSETSLQEACNIGGYDPGICFHSLQEALKSVEADAVVSSTPPEFHKNDAITAMRAGMDVLSEKPMADTMDACMSILRAVLETGRAYAVSQNYRYSSAMWTLANVIRSGRLGAVGQVKIDFFKGVDFGGGFRHLMPYPVIVDMSIHHFDLIRFVTGLEALEVSGASWNPKWSNYKGDCSSTVLFEMNNGARVLYNASWCAKGDFCDWNANWQIECEKGTVTYQNGEIKIHWAPELYTVKETAVEPIIPLAPAGQDRILDDFISCVQEGTMPPTGVLDNINSIAMVFATVKAMGTGQKIRLLNEEITAILKDYPYPFTALP